MNLLVKRAIAVSTIGIASIAGYEGLRTVAYKDPVGIPTICYGYTHNVFMGMQKTEKECVILLEEEVQRFTDGVLKAYKGPISQGELDAYVSFAYNVGLGAFEKSTLLRKLKAGDRRGACDELLRWVYAKGKKLPGLEARRKAENKTCHSGINSELVRS